MQKITMGVIVALTLAALSYAALEASGGTRPTTIAQAAAKRSPADIAARDRMARLVAEVAARSAAQTAKAIVMSRMQPPQMAQASQTVAQAAEEKTASR